LRFLNFLIFFLAESLLLLSAIALVIALGFVNFLNFLNFFFLSRVAAMVARHGSGNCSSLPHHNHLPSDPAPLGDSFV
jgi:hypothetical protein